MTVQSQSKQGAEGYSVQIDLTGNRVFPEAYSVCVFGEWLGWATDDIQLRLAEHYGVPVAQVGEPQLTTYEAFSAKQGEGHA